jgi:hypothetical protein
VASPPRLIALALFACSLGLIVVGCNVYTPEGTVSQPSSQTRQLSQADDGPQVPATRVPSASQLALLNKQTNASRSRQPNAGSTVRVFLGDSETQTWQEATQTPSARSAEIQVHNGVPLFVEVWAPRNTLGVTVDNGFVLDRLKQVSPGRWRTTFFFLYLKNNRDPRAQIRIQTQSTDGHRLKSLIPIIVRHDD